MKDSTCYKTVELNLTDLEKINGGYCPTLEDCIEVLKKGIKWLF